MKKKLLSLILCASLALTLLASCSDKENGKDTDTSGEAPSLAKIEDFSEYITLGQYKGLTAADPGVEVTDEDVQFQIEMLLSEHPDVINVTDRGAQEGDTVNIDYTGTIDGVAFEGGTATDADLVLGSNTYIDGFEDGLIGATVGETKVLDLTFPDPYPNNPDLAGKAVQFTVTVNSISYEQLPEYNDEFVTKNYPDYANTAEFEAYIRESLQADAEESRNTAIISDVWGKVLDNTTVVKYPEDVVTAQLEEAMTYYTDLVQNYYGMELSEFLEQYQSTTLDDFKADLDADVRKSIVEEMVLRQIIKNESLTLTDEEYTSGAQEYADYYDMTIEELENQYGKDIVSDNLLWDKAFEFLRDNAVLQPAEAEA